MNSFDQGTDVLLTKKKNSTQKEKNIKTKSYNGPATMTQLICINLEYRPQGGNYSNLNTIN